MAQKITRQSEGDLMGRQALKIIGTVIAAGIIALFAKINDFDSRLARIETQLRYLQPHVAQK